MRVGLDLGYRKGARTCGINFRLLFACISMRPHQHREFYWHSTAFWEREWEWEWEWQVSWCSGRHWERHAQHSGILDGDFSLRI